MEKEIIKEAAKRHKELVIPPYNAILDMDGFDAICAFSENFNGASVYVPRLRTIFAGCLEQYVINEWNGGNIRDLINKTGFTERHIRNLLKRH